MNNKTDDKGNGTPGWVYVLIAILAFIAWQLFTSNNNTSLPSREVIVVTPKPTVKPEPTATTRPTRTPVPTKRPTVTVKNTPKPAGCPTGCYERKPGCDIKGNISIDSGEKIYHLPGDKYYKKTKISPQYGERWFCTRDEAKANGWRHARR